MLDVEQQWRNGFKAVLTVAPTGSGKTGVKAGVLSRATCPSIAIAHRQELVSQISMALATFGVPHRVFAAKAVVAFCVHRQIEKFGRTFVDHGAKTAVAGVQTLNARNEMYHSFLRHIGLWDIDEGHHVLPSNQWGKAISKLPERAVGVAFTATPIRCDRKPLAVSQGGIFDTMVSGPSAAELMQRGYLSEYQIFGPPPSIRTDAVRVSKATGEFVKSDLTEASRKSTITGDIVDHYLKLASGKRGLTFTVDLETAGQVALAFNNAGVPAMVITGKTPDAQRAEALDRLATGSLMQIVNVDLFGEGMDCPAIEVVSMGRPTQSVGLYLQQFGRVLRPSPGKSYGIVIDHVGNVEKHGLPDAPRQWSLEVPDRRRGKRQIGDVEEILPVRTCTECLRGYLATKSACPYCGHKPIPDARGKPEQVDGDLIEYGPELLAQLRGEIDRIDGRPLIPKDLDNIAARRVQNIWRSRQENQQHLRDSIAAWAGMWKYGAGETDSEIHRRFYHTFGIDVMTAQTLSAADASKLTEAIRGTMI